MMSQTPRLTLVLISALNCSQLVEHSVCNSTAASALTEKTEALCPLGLIFLTTLQALMDTFEPLPGIQTVSPKSQAS